MTCGTEKHSNRRTRESLGAPGGRGDLGSELEVLLKELEAAEVTRLKRTDK